MLIARYFPSFCDDDDFDDYVTEVLTMEALLALPWVKEWEKLDGFTGWFIREHILIAGVDTTGPRARQGWPIKDGCYVAYAIYNRAEPYLWAPTATRDLVQLSLLPCVSDVKTY
jgi:hypothetical protein